MKALRFRRSLADDQGAFSNKALIALVLPLIAEQLLAVTVGMADTVMVSGVGDSAVAAVSTVDTINTLFIQLFTAMSAGGAVVAAQYLGRKEPENACAAARQLVLATACLSIIITVLTLIFHKQVIGLMDQGTDQSTLRQSYTYLLITACSFPFLGLYNGGVGLLRAMGNTKASMWTSIAMNIINIGGNAILIHPCGLGVAGAAIASLLSRGVSAVIILCLLFNENLPVHLEPVRQFKKNLRFDFAMIRRILRIGIPNGLENSLFQVGKVLIMGIITTFPTAIRAANGICNSVSSMVNIPGSAIGLAAIAVVGQMVGAGEKEEARRYGKKLLKWMYICIFPTNLAMIFVAEPVVRLFHLSEEGVPVAVEILMMYATLSIFIYATSFGLPNILRAAGDARYTMIVSVSAMLTLRVGASYVLAYGLGMGLLGVWVAMHLDWVARTVCFCIRFAGNKWLERKVI